MGIIKNNQTDEAIILNAHHQFGRGLQNQTQLTENCISRYHSVIRWEESEWQLIDRSRNGTIINGRHFNHSTKKLSIGSKIQFGDKNSPTWEIIDDHKPSSYLLSKQDNNVIQLTKQNILIRNKKLVASFFKVNTRDWYADFNGETIQLKNRITYQFAGEAWEYIENEYLESTLDHQHIASVTYFLFALSNDEEDVNLKIVVNDLHLDLGTHIYNHLLLRLVRQVIVDEEKNIASGKLGWVSTEDMVYSLSKELLKDVDEYYLNIQIYRLRNNIIKSKPYGHLFTNIIERKKGKLRFNHPNFSITKGGNIITQHLNLATFNLCI